MNIPWSSFTKKRNYNPEKDRLQYKDLAVLHKLEGQNKAKSRVQIVKLSHVSRHYRHHPHRSLAP